MATTLDPTNNAGDGGDCSPSTPAQSARQQEADGELRRQVANGLSTIAVHAGEARQKPGDALTDAIFCASTYSFEHTQAVIDYIENEEPREEYGRYGNPNVRVVERKLAAIEGGERSVAFASGMSAIVGLLMAKLNAGDEVIFFDECYHRTREFCKKHLSRFGVVSREVPTGDFQAMEAAISAQTKLLISESPTNPHLSVIDLDRFAALGKKHHVATMIDATLATPYNLRPLDFGVDYVVHSATKYLGGHNDLLAGCVIGQADALEPVEYLRGIVGGLPAPQTAYLLERGLKTLELRMERHNQNGLALARFLEGHPRVRKVYYPGLESHRDYEIARRTMSGFGGLITFVIDSNDWRDAAKVVDATKLARIAPSLGGVETLIEQPMVMSYFKASPEERRNWGIEDTMIRIACGIENTDDLIADLESALSCR